MQFLAMKNTRTLRESRNQTCRKLIQKQTLTTVKNLNKHSKRVN